MKYKKLLCMILLIIVGVNSGIIIGNPKERVQIATTSSAISVNTTAHQTRLIKLSDLLNWVPAFNYTDVSSDENTVYEVINYETDETLYRNSINQSTDDEIFGLGTLNYNKYVKGYKDGTFRPDGETTRGEFVHMLSYILLGDLTIPVVESSFKDIKENYFAAESINYLGEVGIIGGYEDGTFRPHTPITRAEVAVILARVNGLQENSAYKRYVDVELSHWAYREIQQMSKEGYMIGYQGGTFGPNKVITRAEIVTVLNRIYRPECENLKHTHKNVFSDVQKSHWAYNDILNASNDHIH